MAESRKVLRTLVIMTKKGLVCKVDLKNIMKVPKGDEIDNVFINLKEVR